MYFVYHSVPEPMVNNKLIPLNQMHDEMSDVRSRNLQKYKGREEILARKIPLLNCLWNDVVQFLPLHPQTVFELQRRLGIIPKIPPYKFYEIPLDTLDPEKTVVFFKTAAGEEHTKVQWLKDVDLAFLQEIPPTTVEYYKTITGTGELPFNYQFIPHILHRGTVDIADTKIITLTT